MPEPTEGHTPLGKTREDKGLEKAATEEDIFRNPAKYTGDKGKDPVLKPVSIHALVGEGKFIQDHAEGDFWNPMHEPFHESDSSVSAPTRGGQSGLEWRDFYKGAPKSALHWNRLELIKAGVADPGADGMKAFLTRLSNEQRAMLGLAPQ